MNRETTLEKKIGHRTLRVVVGPHEGRIVASVGVHGDDGRGAWVNFAVRDVPDVIDGLERAFQLAGR